MKISKNIKNHIDTISGKRRITILNSYIKTAYKEPSHAMRNAVGEYSPKMIIEHLNLITGFGKIMCMSNGKGWARYYSYARIRDIEQAFGTLALEFDGVDKNTSKTALRNLLISSASSLESLKTLLGPFTDLKFDSAIEGLTEQISSHANTLQEIQDTAKEASKQASTIQKQYEKSEQASQTFSGLVKETTYLHKQLETQQMVVNELYERTKSISKNVEKLQDVFEKKISNIAAIDNDMKEMRARIENEYYATIERSKEYDVVSAKMQHTQEQSKNIIKLAQHSLNVSQGAGFLESYRDLYDKAARLRETLPWFFGALISFVLTATIIGYDIITVRPIENIMQVLNNPVLIGQLLLVPISLFSFFFCLTQLRKKVRTKKHYQTRFAALETYLRLSEHLPYDSPEQLRTASHIMNYLEEDFNPLVVRASFNSTLAGLGQKNA